MEKVVLKASRRDVIGKQVKAMRRAGQLPAVMYGRHIEKPISIVLDTRETTRALAKVSSSSLVMIDLDGKEIPALIREKQRDFIKNRLLHIDFLVVSLTEKLTASVSIELTGVSVGGEGFQRRFGHRPGPGGSGMSADRPARAHRGGYCLARQGG